MLLIFLSCVWVAINPKEPHCLKIAVKPEKMVHVKMAYEDMAYAAIAQPVPHQLPL